MVRLYKLLYAVSLLGIAFSYGYLCHSLKLFPDSIIKEAYIASLALIQLHSDEEKKHIPNIDFWDDSGLIGPQSSNFSAKAGDEKLFILGNERAHLDLCPKTGCLAWIGDRDGNVLHVWKNTPDLWAPLKNRAAVKDRWYAYPAGAFLYPNGDILVSYQGHNVFPIPMGLAKFDKDSNLIWKRDGFYHHWFSVDHKGNIYVPSVKLVDSPLDIEDRGKCFVCEKSKFALETITVLDPDGNLIKEIDVLTALNKSDLAGIINNDGGSQREIKTCDPLHLNDVRILSPEMAPQFSRFESGDLLLSLRSLNAIGVLDPDTELFKWFYVGAADNQHSPRFLGQDRILLFDNLGGRKSLGSSRVIEVDISNGQMRSLFPQTGSNIPSRPFQSKTAGHIDIHPDKMRMLVAWTHQGLIWEIDLTDGRVLWEYINTHPVQSAFGRMPVYTALYITGNPGFSMNGGKLP